MILNLNSPASAQSSCGKSPSATLDSVQQSTYRSQVNQASQELEQGIKFAQTEQDVTELEKVLFTLWREYADETKGNWKISLDWIALVYHHLNLCKAGDNMPLSRIAVAQTEIQEISQMFPNLMNEYNWIEASLDLINSLAKKWNVVSANNYKHRNESLQIQSIYMEHQIVEMRENFFTMDTIWFAASTKLQHLKSTLPKITQVYSWDLQRQLINIIRFLVKLNQTVDFEEHAEFMWPSSRRPNSPRDGDFSIRIHSLEIDTDSQPESLLMLQTKNPQLVKAHKQMREMKHKEIGFHRFDTYSNWCSCFQRPWERANARLKEMLIDFEQAYRTFEVNYWTQHHDKRLLLIPESSDDSKLKTVLENDDDECSSESEEGEELCVPISTEHNDESIEPIESQDASFLKVAT